MDAILTYPDPAEPDDRLVEFGFDLIIAFMLEFGLELLVELLFSLVGGL